MRNKFFSLLASVTLSAVLLGGCGQKKQEDPTPVNSSRVPVRMTSEEMPGIPGVSTGYRTITIIFETGYSFQIVFSGDPNSPIGYSGFNVITPGGVVTINPGDDNFDDDGGDGAPCTAEVIAFYSQWVQTLGTLGQSSNPCSILNSYFNQLENLLECVPSNQEGDLEEIQAVIEETKANFDCE
jgi:hypothetical protein